MLKRIAVAGVDESTRKALAKQVKKQDVQVVEVDAAGPLAGMSDGLLNGNAPEDAIALALDQADRSEALLNLLAEAVDCRESFKPGSSQRIVEHATRFAKAVKLDENDRLLLERGTLLRDIGKLKIPNDVLLKNGLLTYEEWKLIQDHANIGADLVKEMPGLADIEPIVRRHHECFDGDGYPDKLEGEDIPKLARMLKIIDVFCAMTSPRSYRKDIASIDDAVEHLTAESGKHFDPDLVKIFLTKKVGKAAKD